MRYLRKVNPIPACLRALHQNPPQTKEQATEKWGKRTARNCKKEYIKPLLLDEQYGLCCYSEIRADELGLDYHIEHVENKSTNPSRTFDYYNLAASALSSDDVKTMKTQQREVFGGHAVGKQKGICFQKGVNFQLFISCFDPKVPDFFAYLSDGRVIPKHSLSFYDYYRANYTIQILNLNSPYLVDLRKEWWDELDMLYEEHINKGWCLEYLVEIDLTDCNQRLMRFFSLSRQFYGELAEKVLEQHAPYLL